MREVTGRQPTALEPNGPVDPGSGWGEDGEMGSLQAGGAGGGLTHSPVAVVVKFVVGCHGDEATPRTAQGVEDLRGRIPPHLQRTVSEPLQAAVRCARPGTFGDQPSTSHLGLQDLVPLWGQVVHDTREGSFQGHSTNKQNGQHHIGECGCEVHHLGQDRLRGFP